MPEKADMTGAAPALEARGLTLSWDGGESVVAREISLVADRGEVVCLVGRSGCGKTTVFHALSGLLRPLEGRVLLDGDDLTGTTGRVSYMLQKDLLLPNLTVLDNACLPLVLAGVSRAAAREKARPLLERFGLAGTEGQWPAQLSGGMRQRAAFLRTYLMDNDVILLDEPFSALDAITRVEMRSWFCEMVGELGLSALVVTHDVDEAVSIGNRVYVMAGAPRQGVPSTIVGEVAVARDGTVGEEFEVSPGFIEAKRTLLSLLG